MKLKCSVCGRPGVKIDQNGQGYYLKCRKCGEKLQGFDTEKEAIQEWRELAKIIRMNRKNIPSQEWANRCI